MKYRICALQGSVFSAGLALLMASSPLLAATSASTLSDSAHSTSVSPINIEQAPLLPEVTIASHLVGVPYSSSGVSTTVINPRDLEQQGLQSLNSGLTRTPGVYVLDGGSTNQRGSASQIVIRGMNQSNFNLLMVDGMRVSDPNQSPNNFFGLSNLFNMGSIEVVKGSQGAVYGAGAVAGVVAMTTPHGEGTPGVKLFAEAGSYGTMTSYLTSSGTIKKLSYFVGVGFETTQNDPHYEGSAVYSNAGYTPNDFTHFAEVLRLDYQFNDKAKLSATYRHDDATLESPFFDPGPYGSNTIYRAEDDTRINLATISLDAQLTKMWSITLMTGYYNQHFSQKQYATPYPMPYTSDHDKVQMEWRNQLKWHKKTSTVAGIAWDRAEFAADNTSDQTQNTLGFFAEQLWQPTDSLDFNLAARLDHDSVWDNQFTWRYDHSWKVYGKESPTRLFGSVGSGFRAPTYFEQYADYYSSYGHTVGNPDLSISRSLSGDVGIEQRIYKSHYTTLSAFWTRVDKQISTTYDPITYDATYTNIGHSTSYGVESAFKGDFSDAWRTGYSASYTWVLPKNDDGHQLALTARHSIAGDIHTSPIKEVTTGIGFVANLNRTNWSGTIQEDGSTIYNPLDHFFTLRWYARWQVNDKLALHLRVENLCNAKYVTDDNSSWSGTKTLAKGTAIISGLTYEF